MAKEAQVVASIPMPSGDLVSFRFDQIDKEMLSLHGKLDSLTTNFATNERVSDIEKRLDNYTWYWRAVFTGFVLVIVGVAVALVTRKP